MSVASIGLECGWRIGLWVYWGLGTVYLVYFLNVYTIKAKANKNTWKMGMALRNLKKKKSETSSTCSREVLTPAQLLRWIHFSGWKRNMVFNLHTCLEVHCGLVKCIVWMKWMTFSFFEHLMDLTALVQGLQICALFFWIMHLSGICSDDTTKLSRQAGWRPMKINMLIKRYTFNSSLGVQTQWSVLWICRGNCLEMMRGVIHISQQQG